MITKRQQEYLRSLAHADKVRVLFVCLGNICRSPAADGIMNAVVAAHGAGHRWVIDSAGTGSWHVGQLPDKRMRVHARRRGYELDHICRQVRAYDFENFDLIIAMDADNQRNLRRMAPSPEAEEKIFSMADFALCASRYDYIPDPYYEGAEGFELVLDLLESACQGLYGSLSEA